MKALMATPFNTISSFASSHRGAQAMIYADQIRSSDVNITVNASGKETITDYSTYDTMYIYHGNDWGGSLNLFGGLREFSCIENFVNFTKFKGKVYSLVIPCPDYNYFMQDKINLMTIKGQRDEINPKWWDADFDNLQHIQSEAIVIDPNLLVRHENVAMGDSHAISMYRPGWMLNSVPFKTLYGALNMGLKSFLPVEDGKYKKLEYYFGNIDIRHHLIRQPDPKQATIELVQEYFKAATEVHNDLKLDQPIMLYEPLPIENPSRKIPKSGWFANAPYCGTWTERNDIRNLFIDESLKQQSSQVQLFRWSDKLKNMKGELDFKYMEKPKSVHLSREFYPHWTGIKQDNSIENFLGDL